MARLMKPISLSQLTQEGFQFEIDTSYIEDPSSDPEDTPDILEKKIENSNKECLGIFDEDVYEEGEPFEIIARKMCNLTPNGKIKKRVIREGNGEKPQEFAKVKINYNAYLEYEESPFDSTYVRNKPLNFTIGNGKVLPGLDFAVQSMTVNEKSQFLIDPEYAYGRSCLIGRVPPNATVLFEIELISVVNCGAAVTYETLPEELQSSFTEIHKYCVALCERGKKSFKDRDYKHAIKNYNTAATKLEKTVLGGKDEIELQRELLLKLYTNLLICYARSGEPRKGCFNAKKVYDLTEDGELMKIPIKVYFNHAKCLRILSDYDKAKEVLDKAYKAEPKNPEIANEMLNLSRDRTEHKDKQMAFAKALVNN
ncbi:inactive peptidyl-prolyl cis-trans isomerase shutdown [Tribolium castaneum]|uniref:peptidylprolyl isomerase n=1 Tax=Tribolium castaneum TaxID=7070 RepID=D6WGT5_TRICA|nr:PREDICTED: inactive peptidyl-prolyl cis-trans isomerase shutdown [Tribolium castaneum]EEZ99629.2 Inactive peptidyl-prolyl cis-trans isomerase shutdown-like Protein [Tribolium castaneum]|eukprot:XP_008194055.1 PREDICTED: inactive peptidyl-prolyl cis-trans isomerase shutdown [Tribolium castaneum]